MSAACVAFSGRRTATLANVVTLLHLEIIKDSFTRALVGIYHNRVDYPVESGGVTSEFASR